jgi:hypothetical protein
MLNNNNNINNNNNNNSGLISNNNNMETNFQILYTNYKNFTPEAENNSDLNALNQYVLGNSQITDPKQNSNLNKYLENSINKIILSFIARGALINQHPQSHLIGQNTNETKPDIYNQLDILNFLNNNIKNDFLNLPANFGNVFMNSLIEAYKQNNSIPVNSYNPIPNQQKLTNNNEIYNQNFNNNQNKENNEKRIFQKQEERIVKLKKPKKLTSKSASVSPNKIKPKFMSINDRNLSNQQTVQNYNYTFDNQILNNKGLFDNNNLSLNENNFNNRNNHEEYESFEEEHSKENPIIQKNRILKKNKLNDKNEFETNNNYKKSIKNKIKKIHNSFHPNLNLNGAYFQNEHNPHAAGSDMQQIRSNAGNRGFRRNSKFQKQAENINNNFFNIEEDMKFPRKRLDEANISIKNIEYENANAINQRNNYFDGGVNYQNFNIRNLGSRYIFTPNDLSEMTADLYNQDCQIRNNNNQIQITEQKSIERTNSNLYNNINRIYNNKVESNFSNMGINNSNTRGNIVNNNSKINHHFSNQDTSIKHSLCCKKRNSNGNLSISAIGENKKNNNINASNSKIKSNHSHKGCCKHKHKQKLISSNNNQSQIIDHNIINNNKYNNGYMALETPVKKEIGEEENQNFIDNKDTPLNSFKNQMSFIGLNQNYQNNIRKNYESSLNDNTSSIENTTNKALKNLNLNQNKSAFENKITPNAIMNNYPDYSNFGVGYPKSNFTINPPNLNNSIINNAVHSNHYTPSRQMIFSANSNSNFINKFQNIIQKVEVVQTEYNHISNNNNSGCCRTSSFNNLSSNPNNSHIYSNLGSNFSNKFSGCNNNNEVYKNNEENCHNKKTLHAPKKFCSIENTNSGSDNISKFQEENNKLKNYNFPTNNKNQYNKISNSNSSSSLINEINSSENIANTLYESNLNNNNYNQNVNINNNIINYQTQINQNELKPGSVVVPVFKKNTSHVKIFKPALKNKETVDSFDRIHNFLAPINVNFGGQNNENGGMANISLLGIDNFIAPHSLLFERNFSENKKYPQLCSKNLYSDRPNVDSKFKTAALKKIIRNDNKIEENILDKKCIEICGDLLICPELLPINCQKYLRQDCDCIEKCKEKDSIYRDFIFSNKAINDLEF